MTVGSVKHPNVLPQPAAASSARVSSSYDYNGAGAGGAGGAGGGGGVGGGLGSIQTGGRISPHAPPTSGMMRPSAKRSLFDRPDPIVSKRIVEDHMNNERLRFINRYGFDTHTSKFVTSSASTTSSTTSISSAGLHHRHH